jgi:hypothetical protein
MSLKRGLERQRIARQAVREGLAIRASAGFMRGETIGKSDTTGNRKGRSSSTISIEKA